MTKTRERILQTAERLFAEHGFAGTSLRLLTRHAGVNLAAVNYHFQSKTRLIEVILERRLDLLNNQRLTALASLSSAKHDSTEQRLAEILDAFIRPAILIGHSTRGGGPSFVRLLARTYVENSEELRNFISRHYGHVMRRFSAAIATELPHLHPEELYWRFDFIIGAMTYTMADFRGVKKSAAIADHAQQEAVIERLVHFAVAGLMAPHQVSAAIHTPMIDHFDNREDIAS